MKKILCIGLLLNLSGCAALESSGQCSFAEKPAEYLMNSKGDYINEKGEVTAHKVINPYYQEYLKCIH